MSFNGEPLNHSGKVQPFSQILCGVAEKQDDLAQSFKSFSPFKIPLPEQKRDFRRNLRFPSVAQIMVRQA